MRVEPLEERKAQILAAVVRAHITTGAPVSSSSVADDFAEPLSSATVRHVMATLEEAGYLRPADQKRINRSLAAGRADAEQLLGRVPHVLAELLHGVGMVLIPPLAGTVLGQIRFVLLDDRRLLTVVVTRDGRVTDKVIRPRERFRADELDRMSAFLNENFRGWALGAIRAELERRVAAERSQFLRQAAALCRESLDLAQGSALQLEGVSHLVEQMEAAHPEALGALVQALEEKERLARLLRDCLESPGASPRIQIRPEQGTPAMKDFALIGAPYGRAGSRAGSLGLLGPTRMDYARAITAVTYVAALFDRLLAENRSEERTS